MSFQHAIVESDFTRQQAESCLQELIILDAEAKRSKAGVV